MTLTYTDGTDVHTVEPELDAVFSEIEACGEVCDDILLWTE